eukprot:3787022-Pyramimonas_sp.AAC.1
MASLRRFSTSLTRLVAPEGAPPTTHMAAFAFRHRTLFDAPVTRCVAPMGSSSEGPRGCVRMAAPQALRHTSLA